MGKAKLKMELIPKERLRNVTFKKRKEGLIRKLNEFTTLCDVDACMIIYGPKQENAPVVAETWPPNRDDVVRIVDLYKSKKRDSGNKSFDLNDFFHERKKKIDNELARLRKRNMEAKYPTPEKLIQDYKMNVPGLRAFASLLNNKAELVRARIDELKRLRSSSQSAKHEIIVHQQPVHQQQPNIVSGPSVMNGPFYPHQFGGASSSNGPNFQFASFRQEINFNAGALPFYYAMPLSGLPPLPPPLPSLPQLPFSGGWENQETGREDSNADQYHMKKHEG